ncbi:MAG: VWA domain-containing protein [Planctomycetes bacterium]|nr:VWA domain-containing protein [Planctomycetota bacterium]
MKHVKMGLGLLVAAMAGCAVRLHEAVPQGVSRTLRGDILVIERSIRGTAAQDGPRGGELRVKTPEREVPLPLKHTDVKAQVTILVGSVTVTQQYHNPFAERIEAVYVFPLPENAAVRDFVMTIGERKIRGIIREREEAQRIYHEARRQGYAASLLTQDRPNIFTQAVANIEPGKQIDVSIRYFHTLKVAEGEVEFWFPTVVGPRFNPAGYAGGVPVSYVRPDEISGNDIALEVDVDAGVPIRRLESPSHVVRVERPGPTRAKVTLSANDRIPNKDFVLRWRVADDAVRAALAAFREEHGGYFMLVVQPPASLADIPPQPREMVFVLDCSGSMEGEPLATAKRALERCLRRLGPDDTFQVIRFSDAASAMGDRPIPATPENVRRAIRYVEGLQSEGGTMMEYGIRAALDFPADPGRYRIVSFMTDGYIGNDREILGLVKARLGQARVFSFGIGSSVNRYLLEGMARVGRGVAAFVGLDESSERAVDELYERVERPALSDIRIDWGGMEVEDVCPSPLPDLFVGRPVVMFGRFKGRRCVTVRVSGTVGGARREFAVEVDLDAPALRHEALGCLWARAKIEDLCEEGCEEEAAGRVKRLALEYGLVSEFTSFVAVDSSERTAGEHGTRVVQPALMPKGVKYETTVGERRP